MIERTLSIDLSHTRRFGINQRRKKSTWTELFRPLFVCYEQPCRGLARTMEFHFASFLLSRSKLTWKGEFHFSCGTATIDGNLCSGSEKKVDLRAQANTLMQRNWVSRWHTHGELSKANLFTMSSVRWKKDLGEIYAKWKSCYTWS